MTAALCAGLLTSAHVTCRKQNFALNSKANAVSNWVTG